MKNSAVLLLGLCFCWVLFIYCGRRQTILTPAERVGKILFYEPALSRPAGQSCATCHRPERGYADTLSRAVSEGVVNGRFSMRNAMTIAYSAYVPPLSYDKEEETYVGGLFWDGRVNSLEEQAAEPFLNQMEMSAEQDWIIDQLKKRHYFSDLLTCYGEAEREDTLYAYLTRALAAYERSGEINSFSSKFDAYLAGKVQLNATELKGMELFKNKGKCSECHVMENDPRAGKILFTDHTYDNLGIPVNEKSLFYRMDNEFYRPGQDSVDLGLGRTVRDTIQNGKFRVPTLRNVALSAPYGHNGYFLTLEDIVHFYNVRDVSDEYPPAEYPATVNREELGNLGLTAEEEACIVAFMKTLTDSYAGK